jgi:hypothetical protein
MKVSKCKVCGADIKLKRDVPMALSCRSCYRVAAIDYELNNPIAKGYLGKTYISRAINNYGKVVK